MMIRFWIVVFVLLVIVWVPFISGNDADVLDADWSQAKWEFFKNDCSLVFGDPQTGSMVGALSWCKGRLEFQGNVDESAKKEITVSCFGITNKMIAAALLDKHMQGVKVLVLEDRLQSKGKTDLGGYLASRGVEVVVKKKSALEHNKMVVVDREKVIIGSWNLSGNANGQDNSMIITTDEAVVASALEAMGRIYARDALPDGWPSNMRRDK